MKEPDDDHEPRGADRRARDRRMEHQARWVDLEVQRAIERGEFDGLPGAGRPIDDLGDTHDPDWWLKRLIERERITGVLPDALALRVEDARMHETLDALASEVQVRELLEGFNARVVSARRQLQGGPPVITAIRAVEAEVAAWKERRASRRATLDRRALPPPPERGWRRWFTPRM